MKKRPRTLWWAVALMGVLVLIAWGWQIRRVSQHRPPPATMPTLAVEAAPRAWEWIVIHHSASDAGDAATFDEWHRKRGWDELGYHFVINNGETQPDGYVEVGGRWTAQKQGAHAKSPGGEYNERGIGICLVGNFEKQTPSPAQWRALVELVRQLIASHGIATSHIITHRDVNPKTLCPGQHFDLERLRRDVQR